jgi:hypothetical protein
VAAVRPLNDPRTGLARHRDWRSSGSPRKTPQRTVGATGNAGHRSIKPDTLGSSHVARLRVGLLAAEEWTCSEDHQYDRTRREPRVFPSRGSLGVFSFTGRGNDGGLRPIDWPRFGVRPSDSDRLCDSTGCEYTSHQGRTAWPCSPDSCGNSTTCHLRRPSCTRESSWVIEPPREPRPPPAR